MNFLEYSLLGLLYFAGSSTAFTLGLGYFTLYRPVFSGLITGIILKDPVAGLAAGAVANMLFIDFSSTGGSLKGDPCLAGILSALLSVKLNLSPAAALTLAYPVSMAGKIIWQLRLNFNSVFIKKIEKSDISKLKENLRKYAVIYPQIILGALSVTAVSILSFFIYNVSRYSIIYISGIREYYEVTGILIIILSMADAVLWYRYRYTLLIFFVSYLFSVFVSYDPFLIMIATAVFSLQKRKIVFKEKEHDNVLLRKKDIIKSWRKWMNYTHSCYTFETMQGTAFALSMVPVMKRLYMGRKEKKPEAVRRHFQYFNTEPNIGTVINGYIIQLEEKHAVDKELVSIKQISDVKDNLMGIVAGMGDSVTQKIIEPLFTMGIIMGVFTGNYIFSLVNLIILISAIIYISLQGYFDGYYYGEKGIQRRVAIVKNIKLFRNFEKIFPLIIGLVSGKALLFVLSDTGINFPGYSALLSLGLFIIFNFIRRNGIKKSVIILSLYLLNALFFLVV